MIEGAVDNERLLRAGYAAFAAGDPPARRRRASISSAPYISPEASPAEMRIRTESIVTG